MRQLQAETAHIDSITTIRLLLSRFNPNNSLKEETAKPNRHQKPPYPVDKRHYRRLRILLISI
jgi:hypothetical protein